MNYHIETSPHRVEAWSNVRLPFEPQGWLLTFRSELRAALTKLTARSEEVLHAVFSSAESGRYDIENVLFYNVGSGAFVNSARTGLRFERGTPTAHPHHHLYEVTKSGFSHWTVGEKVAEFSRVGLANDKVQQVWWAVRRSPSTRRFGEILGGRFGLSVILESPRPVNLAGKVKTILDGVISAFHVHDGSDLDELSQRLSGSLAVSASALAQELTDARLNALGSKALLKRLGAGVQWHPADDGCVAVELLYRPGPRLTISGELFRVHAGR